jgi:hypothetical protein
MPIVNSGWTFGEMPGLIFNARAAAAAMSVSVTSTFNRTMMSLATAHTPRTRLDG